MFEKFDWMVGRYQELSEAVSQSLMIGFESFWEIVFM